MPNIELTKAVLDACSYLEQVPDDRGNAFIDSDRKQEVINVLTKHFSDSGIVKNPATIEITKEDALVILNAFDFCCGEGAGPNYNNVLDKIYSQFPDLKGECPYLEEYNQCT